MHNPKTQPDFVLFPSQPSDQTDMLAFEPSRHQHSPYFPQFSMEATLNDPFGFNMDNFSSFAQNEGAQRAPQSYLDTPSLYVESVSDMNKPMAFPPVPSTPPSISEQHMPSLSSVSGPSIASAPSSTIGSPYSGATHRLQEDWIDTNHGLGLPAEVVNDLFPNDYVGNAAYNEAVLGQDKLANNFVDPSLIQPMPRPPTFPQTYPEEAHYLLVPYVPPSPAPSPSSTAHSNSAQQPQPQQHTPPQNHMPPTSSPYQMPNGFQPRPASMSNRRSSISSTNSRRSQQSPVASNVEVDEEGREKGRCPFPECGRVFKDLKAHLLTHQSERPEKCPIVTCEYHFKGFARKYDKNRHTLTHYKGTMVCGFCPGSGSPAEKSFNRADVFKRHLTSVHGVEQTPPNCRRRSPIASNKKMTSNSPDATAKCSTCSATFSNVQDFYEHLDDCVLRVVQQEEPSEAINQKRLAEVASDEEVKKTMEKHRLVDTAGTVDRPAYDNDDDDDDDSNDPSGNSNGRSGKGSLKTTKSGSNSNSRPVLGNSSAVTKPSANAANKARPSVSRRRNNRNNYPQSWGCPSSSMKTKKRVLCVFDGRRRLWKDEMMLDNEFEVRLKLPGGAGDGTNREAYITDLDVETLKRAEGVLNATEEERGPWIEGPSTRLIGQPAMLLPELPQGQGEEVDIDELLS